MPDSACMWIIAENLKYFEIMLNILKFLRVKDIVES